MRVAWILVVVALSCAVVGCGSEVKERLDVSGPDASEDVTLLPGDDAVGGEDGVQKPDWVKPDVADVPAPDVADDIAVPEDIPVEPDVAPACPEGEACDDGDPCTHSDVCIEGACAGTAYDCDDGLECTLDRCLGDGTCRITLRGGYCLIGGACFEDGEAHPSDACLACLPPLSVSAWSPGPAVPCDDEDACTELDVCHDGLCRGAPIACAGGGDCASTYCDSGAGCQTTPLEGACDDGNPCTVGDFCSAGTCQPGETALPCDDGNGCTDDECQAGVGCVFTPNSAPCDDGSVCTTVDVCSGGECVGGAPLQCDDGNGCTDDGCDPALGCVTVNNTAPCDDDDPCSVGDRCVAGSCRPGPGRLDCDDGNVCTDDECVAGWGCDYSPNGNDCEDGSVCTVGDRCSGGQCLAGEGRVDCDDDNPCTDDFCDPVSGCYATANTDPCEDGDACTLGDVCGEGACQPGPDAPVCEGSDQCNVARCDPAQGCVVDPLSDVPCDDGSVCTNGDTCAQGFCIPGDEILFCDDANVCTSNRCDPVAGCVFEPLSDIPCDDMSVCTQNDICVSGGCTGTPVVCDDSNDCTSDSCDDIAGCLFEPTGTVSCWPGIDVYPPRGATLAGADGAVTVSGTVAGVGGPIVSLVINGVEVPFNGATGAFAHAMIAEHGLNMLRIDLEDALGVRREVRQSFQYSEAYWPMDPANPDGARVPDGILMFLASEVIDDGDRSDVDDLATIFETYFQNIDLGSMIPSPAAVQTVDVFLYECTYTVYVSNITHAPPRVYLQPGNGTLRVLIYIDDFYARVRATAPGWWCPDMNSDVTADRVTVDTTTRITMSNGAVNATIQSNNVTFQNLQIDDDNWFVNLVLGIFRGTIQDALESAFEDQIADMVPQLLEDTLAQLALDQAIEIPGFLPGQAATSVTLDSELSSLQLTPTGMTVGLAPVMMAPAHLTPYTPLGSIARDSCLTGVVPSFALRESHALELALFDDVLNELLYSVYMGGALELDIDPATLGGFDLSGYGISDLLMHASFMLPPIAEWCDDAQPLRLQVGDIAITATMSFLTQPVEVLMYASFEAEGDIALVAGEAGGYELGLLVNELSFVDVEIADITEGVEGLVPVIKDLIETQLLPSLLEGLTGSALGSFPIPEIDLSALADGIPPGTVIAIDPQDLWRDAGYTAVGGGMQSTGQ